MMLLGLSVQHITDITGFWEDACIIVCRDSCFRCIYAMSVQHNAMTLKSICNFTVSMWLTLNKQLHFHSYFGALVTMFNSGYISVCSTFQMYQ